MFTKRKELILSLITILIAVILVCVLVEILLRVFTPDWLEFRMKEVKPNQAVEIGSDRQWPVVEIDDEFKSFTPQATFEVTHFEYSNIANIDEYGGRITNYYDQEILVPFFGDSFTFGVGVEDQQTYVSLLSKPGQGRFLNLGAPGIALDKQLDLLEMRYQELGQPKTIIFSLFIGNDFVDIYENYTQKNSVNGKTKKKQPTLLFRINKWVYRMEFTRRMYSFQFVRQKLLSLLNRNNPQHMNPIFREARTDTPFLREANTLFLKELQRLKQLADTLKFEYYFIVLPDLHQINQTIMLLKANYYNIDLANLDMKAPNRLLAENFVNNGIDFIDVTECLKNDAHIDKLFYTHDTHLTQYGHEITAKCLEREGFSRFLKTRRY